MTTIKRALFAIALSLATSSHLNTAAFTLAPTKRINPHSLHTLRAAHTASPSFAEDIQAHKFDVAKTSEDNDGTIEAKREELKSRLLEAADQFKALQKEAEIGALQVELEEPDYHQAGDGRFLARLFRKILSKILRRNKKRKRTAFRRDAFATTKLEVGETGNEIIIALAEELAKYNPTAVPTYGFQGYGGGLPSQSPLSGLWKLRFTTAADATFQTSPNRGSISTSQEIDAIQGTLTNVVDFERGKLKGFRVVVAGEAVAGDEMDLTFRRVEILRHSKFPFLRRFVVPIPSRLLRTVNRYLSKKDGDQDTSSERGPFLQIKYLDDDIRIHKTGEGNWFIQSRLE